jgi:hypothetical protein
VILIGDSIEVGVEILLVVGGTEAEVAGSAGASETRGLDWMRLFGGACWRSATEEIDDGREPEPGGGGTARLAAARLGRGGGGAAPGARIGVDGRVESREVRFDEVAFGSEASVAGALTGGDESVSTTRGFVSGTTSSEGAGADVVTVSSSFCPSTTPYFGLTGVGGAETGRGKSAGEVATSGLGVGCSTATSGRGALVP